MVGRGTKRAGGGGRAGGVGSEVPLDYPARIKELRSKHALTQVRLAELMSVSFASINRWENGAARPSRLAWEKIARAEQAGLGALRDGAVAPWAPIVQAAPVALAAPPPLDFAANPEVVRAVAEAERLTYGHLFNPAFATEVSTIDPLPHQRIAVYEEMLPQTRLRFLLADDAGAGKTVMAGLYIREMLARRLIRRVLIVPPAGLVGNWEQELRSLFGLRFRVVAGAEAKEGNPFSGYEGDRLIVSVDTLAGDRMFGRLQEGTVEPYDLVIFDEAHKLSAHRDPDFTVRKTDRYELAEALAGAAAEQDDPRWQLPWRARHLLLLTATPHMGADFPYYSLWRLLEPEALSTQEAFNAYPADARRQHFIRRTKEEMVRFDETPIYPTRISDTLSYDLTPVEQQLYDETTDYIQHYYNRARMLNRSAARLAMSVFQRRLASSTYALLRSFERRLEKLAGLIGEMRAGRLDPQRLALLQRRPIRDVLDEKTADEEGAEDGREEHELAEDEALGAVVAADLAELEVERQQVVALRDLAQRAYELGDEAKFEKLREVLRDARFGGEKVLIFTEHRDTLEFLVRRLEGLGFTGQVARIHGGMDYREREAQVEFFREPNPETGARTMVATDAAGEGINLQFCWLMANYDVPWNPARLEQRMGRIHRYGQKRDPVIIVNLVAGKTREGRVLYTLLDKLERIRKELRSDKVFDVVGRLFEGVSLKAYMEQAVTEEGADDAQRRIDGTLTPEQVAAIAARERALLGDGGDVRGRLPGLRREMERQIYRRLLPGYVLRFMERAAPLVGIDLDPNPDGTFSLRAREPGALDPLWPLLEAYPPDLRQRLSVAPGPGVPAIFLHPGEPLFDRFAGLITARFAREAGRGAVFIDPTAREPYLFHLARIEIERRADPDLRLLAHPQPPADSREGDRSKTPREPAGLAEGEMLECRLVGLKQTAAGAIEECAVESLLLLKGGHGLPPGAVRLAAGAADALLLAQARAGEIAARLASERRAELLASLPEREIFLRRGFDYQEAELAAARSKLSEKAGTGDPGARVELARVKERQRRLLAQREAALAAPRREAALVGAAEVTFLAHALVVPTGDPDERKRYDAEVEAIAMRLARAHEEALGATVQDVSSPELALVAGLSEHPGFDLLSRHPSGDERAIEVKGRAAVGDVELTENEWSRACNAREGYWLYVAFHCAGPQPRLIRVRDPFGGLLVRAKGGVVVSAEELSAAGGLLG